MTELTELRDLRRFRPYPQYRDSGIEWLGEVPIDWEVHRLKFLLQEPLQYGANEPAEMTDPNLPRYIRITDVGEDGRLRDDTFRSIPEDVARPYLLEYGDLLFARSGATVGKTFRFEPGWGKAAHAGYLIRARLKSQACSSRFVQYFTTSRGYWDWLRSNFIQATIQNVSADRYSNLEIPLPELREQLAIAAFLDRETAKINALVAKKERLIELLQEKRTALITRAVTRGLDPNVARKDSGVEWLGEIPAHWESKKIKRLFVHTKRQGFPERTVLSVYREYGVIEKSSRDDNFNRTPKDLDTYQLVNPGDLVINKMKAWQGSLGISPLSGITSPDYIVYAPHHKANARFLHHFLRCKLLASVYLTLSNGIRPSQWRLEPERFEDLIVFLPPPAEQARTAAFLDGETGKVDSLISKIQEAIVHLNEFRTVLISAAVTGKIDVREAMPR